MFVCSNGVREDNVYDNVASLASSGCCDGGPVDGSHMSAKSNDMYKVPPQAVTKRFNFCKKPNESHEV